MSILISCCHSKNLWIYNISVPDCVQVSYPIVKSHTFTKSDRVQSSTSVQLFKTSRSHQSGQDPANQPDIDDTARKVLSINILFINETRGVFHWCLWLVRSSINNCISLVKCHLSAPPLMHWMMVVQNLLVWEYEQDWQLAICPNSHAHLFPNCGDFVKYNCHPYIPVCYQLLLNFT